ncbi:MAG: hypothetical protein HETSPECPRED_000886 [Heterodermia speciosa]|uniref:Copper acquisition factor BIM1-like domain-containing protein n=1 Tax=Heterodermia speciosa TaxID=116794 RepID=A0A8H3EV22_9LECA|nr:MAG: hypothetical protein HETSPECPRED_000886 [Heterodermia speciosa]
MAQFPCGGKSTPSENRTQWSLTGGPIQLQMEHDEAQVQVLLGLGNDPGVNFNITLLPTIQEQGIGQFCLGDVVVPEGVATEGLNATIQVVTNGDPQGGLYNCADITFTSSAPTGTECKNGTGIRATDYTGEFANANGTGAAANASGTGSAAGATGTGSTGQTGAVGKLNVAGWTLVVGGAAVGAAALL